MKSNIHNNYQYDKTIFEKTDFKKNKIKNSTFEECKFNNIDFSESTFINCKFTDCNFTESNLSLCTFTNSKEIMKRFKIAYSNDRIYDAFPYDYTLYHSSVNTTSHKNLKQDVL